MFCEEAHANNLYQATHSHTVCDETDTNSVSGYVELHYDSTSSSCCWLQWLWWWCPSDSSSPRTQRPALPPQCYFSPDRRTTAILTLFHSAPWSRPGQSSCSLFRSREAPVVSLQWPKGTGHRARQTGVCGCSGRRKCRGGRCPSLDLRHQ